MSAGILTMFFFGLFTTKLNKETKKKKNNYISNIFHPLNVTQKNKNQYCILRAKFMYEIRIDLFNKNISAPLFLF